MRLLAFVLAATFGLAGSAGAQPVAAQQEKCVGGGEGAKCGGGDLQLRVLFDEESAKGEITCKEGKLKGKEVEFKKCLQDKLDAYEDVAVAKKIVDKDKLEALDKDAKDHVKELAFLDSAHGKLESKLGELEADKDDIEYKKAKGALKKIRGKYKKSINKCEANRKKGAKFLAIHCPKLQPKVKLD